MPRKSRRMTAGAMILASGAFLMQSPNFGCESFIGETAMSALDFCFIFDCNSGILGGTVQPCPEDVSNDGTATDNFLFVDCPVNDE